MPFHPPTVVLRHRRENLKKCSLRGLERRDDIVFYSYPRSPLPDLGGYVLLTLDAPVLSLEDRGKGIFLIDALWRYAPVMFRQLKKPYPFISRSLPQELKTAYPRRQGDCPEPQRGLASIEALYTAYAILGYDTETLLDHFYWKEAFLRKNETFFSKTEKPIPFFSLPK